MKGVLLILLIVSFYKISKPGNKIAVLDKFKVYEEKDAWVYESVFDIGIGKFFSRPNIKDFKFISEDVELCVELNKMELFGNCRIEWKDYVCYGCWIERYDCIFNYKPLAFDQMIRGKDIKRYSYLITMNGFAMKIDKKQEEIEYNLEVED